MTQERCGRCGTPFAVGARDGRCAVCGALIPPGALSGPSGAHRLTDFGCGVAGWGTGFLLGVGVSCSHLHSAHMLGQRHVLTPLATAVAGALAYTFVARIVGRELRPGFELVVVAGMVGAAASAAVSVLWPCTMSALAAVAVLVAAAVGALMAPSFLRRPEAVGSR